MLNITPTLVRLKKQNKAALGSFNKIVTDLTANNKEILSEKDDREKQILVLKDQIQELASLEVSNNKIINKINKFLSDED